MKKTNIILFGITMLLMTGCATVFTGSKDTIHFNTTPQGAEVYIDGLKVCETPCTSTVKRSLSDKFFELKLDGYETRVVTFDRTFNAVSIINLGFLLGWGIDAATGALMKYDRKGYDIELEKVNQASLKNATKIEINTVEKLVDVYVIKEKE
ncbi:PEGA domain-containing protein [bacterium]|jgi:hypothetical protein|nr:PEGA domain-containing protein [bacterium]